MTVQHMAVGVERYTSVAPLAADWDDLADRTGASPFVRPGWIAAWWDAFGRGKLDVLAVRRDGRLAAVLPVVRRAGGVHSPSNWHTPEYGAVSEDAAAAREAFDALFAARPAYAFLRFFGPGGDEAAAAGAVAGYATGRRVIQQSPYLPLDGGWESLRRPRQKQIERNRKKLAELGELAFTVHDARHDLDERLEEAFATEGSGWKLANGTAIVSQPATRQFYTAFARWAAGRGILRLFFLRVDGRPVAGQIGVADRGRYYFLKGGYEPELGKLGPGIVLLNDIVHWAADEGLTTFDFLGKPEPQKLEWTDALRELVAVEAFSPSPAGIAARTAYARGRPLAKKLVALRASGRSA
jgi:CelD/BcsL family acetyltransferase involved in cellulose biosynthesis